MEAIHDAWKLVRNILTLMNVWDFIDIIVVAVIIYALLMFVRRTNSGGVLKGIIVLLILLGVSDILNLSVVNYLLERTMEIGVLAIVVLFAPEIRKFLSQMGSRNIISFLRHVDETSMETCIERVVTACADMSKTRTGALIVFQRDIQLQDFVRTGTVLNAEVSTELIKNIFYPKTPLHDGAVIIIDGKVAAAACMLPMSTNTNLSRDLGMRHRAGIGLSERNDSVVVIVSEETGAISVAIDGMLKRHLSHDTFEKLLLHELLPENSRSGSVFSRLTKVGRNGK